MARKKLLPPMHPGEVLREEFLKPLGMSAGKLAKLCNVQRSRIERIAEEKIGITGDTAIRLSRVFGTTAEFWLNLQKHYELEMAERAAASDQSIKAIERIDVERAA